MKIVDERETQKAATTTTKKSNKDTKEQEETEAIVKGSEPNDQGLQLTYIYS